MTAGDRLSHESIIADWQMLPEGGVLVIVNSEASEIDSVAAVFDRLASRVARSQVHVVAAAAWTSWLQDRGVAPDHILTVRDAQGRPLELNFFLETPAAGIWIRSRPCEFIVGTDAHSLYNEEVKDLFEERLCLFVGRSRFLAHTLPHEFVYIFDLAMLRHRLGRRRREREYLQTCRAMVDAWHQQWIQAGRPGAADTGGANVVGVLAEHLGAAVLTFDESSIIPLKQKETFESDAEAFRYLQDLVARTQSLQEEIDRRQHEIDRRDQIIIDEIAFREKEIASRDQLFTQEITLREQEISRRDVLIAEAHADLGRAIMRYDNTVEGLVKRLLRKVRMVQP